MAVSILSPEFIVIVHRRGNDTLDSVVTTLTPHISSFIFKVEIIEIIPNL